MKAIPDHILVIDDDRRIRTLLQQYLVDQGYFVSVAEDANAARAMLQEYVFDALVVDVMMPGEDGMSLTASLQGKIDAPVLMLTAMGEVENRISGLESGAEDYLGKPFDPLELLLRIQKLIGRTKRPEKNTRAVTFGGYEFDIRKQQLSRRGVSIELTSKEAKALGILIANAGVNVPRDVVAKQCGGMNGRSVDVLITRLRNKIEKNPKSPVYLKTIWGEGYVFHP